MRLLLTSYPFIIFRSFLFPLWGLGGLLLLYPSCELVQTGHALSPISATILLDFSDPNTHPDGTGGYRYIYDGESYLATYNAWTTWNCQDGPNFFAAWDDTSLTVWLATCHALTSPPLGAGGPSITAQSGDNAPLPIVSSSPVAGAHEPTYQLTLDPSNYVDIENGVTTIILAFSYN
jgi:hypothetical protein